MPILELLTDGDPDSLRPNEPRSAGSLVFGREGQAAALTATTAGNLDVTGTVRTGHDALYKYPQEMTTNGTLVTEAAQNANFPRITFADAATQRAKWVWAIPQNWNSVIPRFGWQNEGAGAGNVQWQLSVLLLYLGGNTTTAVTTFTPSPAAALGQNVFNYFLSFAAIATPAGLLLGEYPVMLCSLERVGGAGGDTLANAAGLLFASLTRAS